MARSARLSHKSRLLWLTVDSKITVYIIEDARPDPTVAFPAFRLMKADGETYTCGVNEFGATCTCADCNYRSRKCKHILGMIAVGLIPKPTHGYHEESE